MGWFTSGSNNPLDNVDVPKDQLPPEVEKPKTEKDIKNIGGSHDNFEAMSRSLGNFNKVVTELHTDGIPLD